MQLSPVELILGETTIFVRAVNLRLTFALLRKSDTIFLLRTFLVAIAITDPEIFEGMGAAFIGP